MSEPSPVVDGLMNASAAIRRLQEAPTVFLAEPFFGIGGAFYSLTMGGIHTRLRNTCDTDEKLGEFNRKRGELAGIDLDPCVCYGEMGNMMNWDTSDLQDVDILCCGPPCQPWASSGKRRGEDDPRSSCYWRVVDWIEYLSVRGCLKAYLIENSPEIMSIASGGKSFAEVVLERLSGSVPFFKHSLSMIGPGSSCLHRERAWLRGVRVDVLANADGVIRRVPAPLLRLECPRALVDVIVKGLSNTQPSDLAHNRREHLALYVALVKQDVAAGRAGDIAVFDVERSPRRAMSGFTGTVMYDRLPSFRTGGPALFLATARDIHKPLDQREVFRLMHVDERFRAQGYPACTSTCSDTIGLCRRVTGNAYPVDMVARALYPIVDMLAEKGFLDGTRRSATAQDLARMANTANSCSA